VSITDSYKSHSKSQELQEVTTELKIGKKTNKNVCFIAIDYYFNPDALN